MSLKAKNNHLIIQPCPCCSGLAEWVDVKASSIILWQLACNQCGLATNLEDKKSTCLLVWNKRHDNNRIKIVFALMLLTLLLTSIMAFVLGMIFSSIR
ncbi:MAG: hypothetical protein HAW67_06540 [Endozoicomonadaceae bacterium]|nr:hypothetical protein [Endozoicomonadaceae bacterium]MBE8233378.1 hypothetical protein [Endozoicomonadaceae bacterium]